MPTDFLNSYFHINQGHKILIFNSKKAVDIEPALAFFFLSNSIIWPILNNTIQSFYRSLWQKHFSTCFFPDPYLNHINPFLKKISLNSLNNYILTQTHTKSTTYYNENKWIKKGMFLSTFNPVFVQCYITFTQVFAKAQFSSSICAV